MAKRFTDSTKWARQSYRALPPKGKLIWQYLTDCCDHAGIWHEDLDLMSFQIGMKITKNEFDELVGDKVIPLKGDRYFIPSFVEFQYGELREDCNTHKSVISTLTKQGLYDSDTNSIRTVPEQLNKSSVTLVDKNKDKDKDQEKERGGAGEKTKPKLDFESLYEKYPLKVGKGKGLAACERDIRSPEDYALLSAAIDRYCNWLKEPGFRPAPKHFSTFMNCWRDYTHDDFGKQEITPQPLGTAKYAPPEKVYSGPGVPDADATARMLREKEAEYVKPDAQRVKNLINRVVGA